jgi:hypothetical protein
MGDIAQFIALPIDRTDQGLVPGEAHKCASPASAIERAKGFGRSSAMRVWWPLFEAAIRTAKRPY